MPRPDFSGNKDFFINQTENIKTLPERYHITQAELFIAGVFDGANVRLEVCPDKDMDGDPDDHEWYDSPNGNYTGAADEVRFWNVATLSTLWVRAVMTDAGQNTRVSFRMRPRLATGH